MSVCSNPHYSYYEESVRYAWTMRKWIVVHSRGAQKAKALAFEKNLQKELEAHETSLWHISNQEYYCDTDALEAANKWIAERPILKFEKLGVAKVKKETGREEGKAFEERGYEYFLPYRVCHQDEREGGGTKAGTAGPFHRRHQ